MQRSSKFHRYVAALFIITVLLGFFLISKTFYAAQQNIIVIDCSANELRSGIYKYFKDKRDGVNITEESFNFKITTICLQLFYRFHLNRDLRHEWILQEIKYLSKKGDMTDSDAVVMINFSIIAVLSKPQIGDLYEMLKQLKSNITSRFKEVYITSADTTMDPLLKYITLNSIYPPKDKTSRNLMLSFASDSFSVAYKSERDIAIKLDETLHTHELNIDDNVGHIYATQDYCYGYAQVLLKIYLEDIKKKKNAQISVPCIPTHHSIDSSDYGFFNLESQCMNATKTIFSLVGAGNVRACDSLVRSYLIESVCKKDKDEGCIHIPKSKPSLKFDINYKMYGTENIANLIRDLYTMRNITPHDQDFVDQYIQAKYYFCEENLKDKKSKGFKYYCFLLTYYEWMLHMFGIPLRDWKKLEFSYLKNGIVRGLAIMEANSHQPQIILPLVSAKEIYSAVLFLFLLFVYFYGMAGVHTNFLTRSKKRLPFVRCYNILLNFQMRQFKKSPKNLPPTPVRSPGGHSIVVPSRAPVSRAQPSRAMISTSPRSSKPVSTNTNTNSRADRSRSPGSRAQSKTNPDSTALQSNTVISVAPNSTTPQSNAFSKFI